MWMLTPKRLRHHFQTLEGANVFAKGVRATGGRDVIVIEAVNAEDLARGYSNPRVNGATVIWTQDTAD